MVHGPMESKSRDFGLGRFLTFGGAVFVCVGILIRVYLTT
jgi:hypothetical protein